MKKGDKVIVYQDPYTRLRPEGTATLVKQLCEADEDGMSRWEVSFPGDYGTFERNILATPEGA